MEFFSVVVGCDEGTIMIKLGCEEPVASMYSSARIIWSKHNKIQAVNIKTVSADIEVNSFDMLLRKSCEIL